MTIFQVIKPSSRAVFLSILGDMNQSDFEQRIKENAYRLFHAELLNHVEKASKTFCSGRQASEPELKEVGKSFHTVRGGAGFFGLEDLEALAGKVEELLLDASAHTEHNLQEAKAVIEEITAMAQQLPKP